MGEEVLYIGIDLGTFRSVMVSSDSHEEEELTVIGTPKDPIARNFLKRDYTCCCQPRGQWHPRGESWFSILVSKILIILFSISP